MYSDQAIETPRAPSFCVVAVGHYLCDCLGNCQPSAVSRGTVHGALVEGLGVVLADDDSGGAVDRALASAPGQLPDRQRQPLSPPRSDGIGGPE